MQHKLLNQGTQNTQYTGSTRFFVTVFKLIFFRFLKISGTLKQNLGPKYLKEFRPSPVLGLSTKKIIVF